MSGMADARQLTQTVLGSRYKLSYSISPATKFELSKQMRNIFAIDLSKY
jgi:hypothetical protein